MAGNAETNKHVFINPAVFFFVVPFVLVLVGLAVSKMTMEPGAQIAVPACGVVIGLLFYLTQGK